MKKGLLLLLFIFLCVQCTQKKTLPITEFSERHAKSGILVDVRTPEEYQAGHLDNAININWYDPDFTDQIGGLEKDKTIYLYCKLGGRSARAAGKLDSLGYKAVDLTGGYDAYIATKED